MPRAKRLGSVKVQTQEQLQALVDDIRRDWATHLPSVRLVPPAAGRSVRLELDLYARRGENWHVPILAASDIKRGTSHADDG
jgi:hypothetical protein